MNKVTTDRKCCICEAPIGECMGFVNAGDFLAWCNDEKETVRELCGACAEANTRLDEIYQRLGELCSITDYTTSEEYKRLTEEKIKIQTREVEFMEKRFARERVSYNDLIRRVDAALTEKG